MDRNEAAKFSYLWDKSVEFGLQTSHPSCSKVQALYTVQSSFMKTLEYAAPFPQFSLLKWYQILSAAFRQTLQRVGITHNTPCTALFALLLHQGRGGNIPTTHKICNTFKPFSRLLSLALRQATSSTTLQRLSGLIWGSLSTLVQPPTSGTPCVFCCHGTSLNRNL